MEFKELTFLGRIYHTGFGFIKEKDSDMVINYGYNYDDDGLEHDDVSIPYNELIERANKTVNYKKVILKFGPDFRWYKMPEQEWYNNPEGSGWWQNTERKLLPTLTTKPYIKIVNKFLEVEIDANLKGSPITLEDILFATRCLALDDTRTACNYNDTYTVLSYSKDVLVLDPGIDNFSTQYEVTIR